MQKMHCQHSINWKMATLLFKWMRQEVRAVASSYEHKIQNP